MPGGTWDGEKAPSLEQRNLGFKHLLEVTQTQEMLKRLMEGVLREDLTPSTEDIDALQLSRIEAVIGRAAMTEMMEQFGLLDPKENAARSFLPFRVDTDEVGALQNSIRDSIKKAEAHMQIDPLPVQYAKLQQKNPTKLVDLPATIEVTMGVDRTSKDFHSNLANILETIEPEVEQTSQADSEDEKLDAMSDYGDFVLRKYASDIYSDDGSMFITAPQYELAPQGRDSVDTTEGRTKFLIPGNRDSRALSGQVVTEEDIRAKLRGKSWGNSSTDSQKKGLGSNSLYAKYDMLDKMDDNLERTIEGAEEFEPGTILTRAYRTRRALNLLKGAVFMGMLRCNKSLVVEAGSSFPKGAKVVFPNGEQMVYEAGHIFNERMVFDAGTEVLGDMILADGSVAHSGFEFPAGSKIPGGAKFLNNVKTAIGVINRLSAVSKGQRTASAASSAQQVQSIPSSAKGSLRSVFSRLHTADSSRCSSPHSNPNRLFHTDSRRKRPDPNASFGHAQKTRKVATPNPASANVQGKSRIPERRAGPDEGSRSEGSGPSTDEPKIGSFIQPLQPMAGVEAPQKSLASGLNKAERKKLMGMIKKAPKILRILEDFMIENPDVDTTALLTQCDWDPRKVLKALDAYTKEKEEEQRKKFKAQHEVQGPLSPNSSFAPFQKRPKGASLYKAIAKETGISEEEIAKRVAAGDEDMLLLLTKMANEQKGDSIALDDLINFCADAKVLRMYNPELAQELDAEIDGDINLGALFSLAIKMKGNEDFNIIRKLVIKNPKLNIRPIARLTKDTSILAAPLAAAAVGKTETEMQAMVDMVNEESEIAVGLKKLLSNKISHDDLAELMPMMVGNQKGLKQLLKWADKHPGLELVSLIRLMLMMDAKVFAQVQKMAPQHPSLSLAALVKIGRVDVGMVLPLMETYIKCASLDIMDLEHIAYLVCKSDACHQEMKSLLSVNPESLAYLGLASMDKLEACNGWDGTIPELIKEMKEVWASMQMYGRVKDGLADILMDKKIALALAEALGISEKVLRQKLSSFESGSDFVQLLLKNYATMPLAVQQVLVEAWLGSTGPSKNFELPVEMRQDLILAQEAKRVKERKQKLGAVKRMAGVAESEASRQKKSSIQSQMEAKAANLHAAAELLQKEGLTQDSVATLLQEGNQDILRDLLAKNGIDSADVNAIMAGSDPKAVMELLQQSGISADAMGDFLRKGAETIQEMIESVSSDDDSESEAENGSKKRRGHEAKSSQEVPGNGMAQVRDTKVIAAALARAGVDGQGASAEEIVKILAATGISEEMAKAIAEADPVARAEMLAKNGVALDEVLATLTPKQRDSIRALQEAGVSMKDALAVLKDGCEDEVLIELSTLSPKQKAQMKALQEAGINATEALSLVQAGSAETVLDFMEKGDAESVANLVNAGGGAELAAQIASHALQKVSENMASLVEEGVDAEVARALANSGLGADQVAELKKKGMDVETLNRLVQDGMSAEAINALTESGMGSDAVAKLAKSGLSTDSITDLAQLGLTQEMIQEMQNNGVSLDAIAELLQSGVRAEEVVEMIKKGASPKAVKDLLETAPKTRLQREGLTDEVVEQLQENGLDIEIAVELVKEGADPVAVVAMAENGLTADDVAILAASGMDLGPGQGNGPKQTTTFLFPGDAMKLVVDGQASKRASFSSARSGSHSSPKSRRRSPHSRRASMMSASSNPHTPRWDAESEGTLTAESLGFSAQKAILFGLKRSALVTSADYKNMITLASTHPYLAANIAKSIEEQADINLSAFLELATANPELARELNAMTELYPGMDLPAFSDLAMRLPIQQFDQVKSMFHRFPKLKIKALARIARCAMKLVVPLAQLSANQQNVDLDAMASLMEADPKMADEIQKMISLGSSDLVLLSNLAADLAPQLARNSRLDIVVLGTLMCAAAAGRNNPRIMSNLRKLIRKDPTVAMKIAKIAGISTAEVIRQIEAGNMGPISSVVGMITSGKPLPHEVQEILDAGLEEPAKATMAVFMAAVAGLKSGASLEDLKALSIADLAAKFRKAVEATGWENTTVIEALSGHAAMPTPTPLPVPTTDPGGAKVFNHLVHHQALKHHFQAYNEEGAGSGSTSLDGWQGLVGHSHSAKAQQNLPRRQNLRQKLQTLRKGISLAAALRSLAQSNQNHSEPLIGLPGRSSSIGGSAFGFGVFGGVQASFSVGGTRFKGGKGMAPPLKKLDSSPPDPELLGSIMRGKQKTHYHATHPMRNRPTIPRLQRPIPLPHVPPSSLTLISTSTRPLPSKARGPHPQRTLPHRLPSMATKPHTIPGLNPGSTLQGTSMAGGHPSRHTLNTLSLSHGTKAGAIIPADGSSAANPATGAAGLGAIKFAGVTNSAFAGSITGVGTSGRTAFGAGTNAGARSGVYASANPAAGRLSPNPAILTTLAKDGPNDADLLPRGGMNAELLSPTYEPK